MAAHVVAASVPQLPQSPRQLLDAAPLPLRDLRHLIPRNARWPSAPRHRWPPSSETTVSATPVLIARDVERITRGVFDTSGIALSSITATATTSGWRLVVVDRAGRVITVALPHGQAAEIRHALLRQIEDW